MSENLLKDVFRWVTSDPQRLEDFINSFRKPDGSPKQKRTVSPATREKIRLAAVKRWEAARVRQAPYKVGTGNNGSSGLRRGHGNSK